MRFSKKKRMDQFLTLEKANIGPVFKLYSIYAIYMANTCFSACVLGIPCFGSFLGQVVVLVLHVLLE